MMKRSFINVILFLLVTTIPAYGDDTPNATSGDGSFEVFLPLVMRPDPTRQGPDWLVRVNTFRQNAGLTPLLEMPSWSIGSEYHSRYMVKNDFIGHYEDPGNPWYTLEGAQAAPYNNLVVSHSPEFSDVAAIDLWMQAPFHAVGILDPALHFSAFGSYRESDGGFQSGAALDVGRGKTNIPASVQFPVMWPADGEVVPYTSHTTEVPNPLTSCAGYSVPTGLPIILQIGDGQLTPNVTAHSFRQGSTDLAHCVFDETNYANPNGQYRDLGRNILGSRDAVVLIPRSPLTPGASYTVSITVNGQTHTWTFTVSDSAAVTSMSTGDSHGLPEFDDGRFESIEMAAALIN